MARASAYVDSLLKMAAENGGQAFNIFLTSSEIRAISPNRDPRVIQAEIRTKIEHFKNIDNVRFTRTCTVIIITKDVLCAIDACKIATVLGVQVTFRIIWENITKQFLLLNIPVDIPLAEVGQEI